MLSALGYLSKGSLQMASASARRMPPLPQASLARLLLLAPLFEAIATVRAPKTS